MILMFRGAKKFLEDVKLKKATFFGIIAPVPPLPVPLLKLTILRHQKTKTAMNKNIVVKSLQTFLKARLIINCKQTVQGVKH